jgi:V8-like Glu-specific endopeptidase
MRRKIIAAAAAAAALAAAGTALAIVNGTPDGDGHPYVGALLAPQAFSDGTWSECSGTLITPTVFLTAAHCDEGTTRVNVTFDSHYTPGTSATYVGTWHADPQYTGHAAGDPHDIAVVVLDQAPPIAAHAELPSLGQLSSLPKNQSITSVGYGAQSVTSDHGGKTLHYEDTRYVATGSLTTLTPVYLKASMNPSHGDGGTCYGDSGGPNFIGTSDVVAATTITGDMWCRSTNVDYRLDTQVARDFLAPYLR